MEGSDSWITSLQFPLYLASIPRESLDRCTKILMKLALYSESSSNFLSYTETDEEISIIVDEESLSLLRNVLGEDLLVAPRCWSAIRVYEGASAIDSIGLVSHLSEPLFKENLNMVYLSTFHTDLILVPKEENQKAISLLQSMKDVQTTRKESGDVVMTWEPSVATASNVKKTDGLDSTIIVTTMPHRLVIASFEINPENIEKASHSLLRQFFFPSSSERIFSYTSSVDEVTLILDTDSLSTFPENFLKTNSIVWKAIQIQLSGTDFSGANVHTFSQILASASVSIYYLSTANSDYILVPEDKIEEALTALGSRLKILT